MTKSLLHAFNVTLISLLLVSCNRSSSSTTPQNQTHTSAIVISFATFASQLRQVEELSEQFTKLHPDITIEVRTVEEFAQDSSSPSWEAHVATLAAVVDVFVAPEPDPVLDNPVRYVLDLGPFVIADPGFDRQDFFPTILERFRRGENLWGVPSEGRLHLMFYRPALFDAAGAPYPQADWSWRDLEILARALTIQTAGATPQYGFADPGGATIIPFIQGQVELTTPQAVEADLEQEGTALNTAVQQYASLAHAGLMPDPNAPSGEDLIASGQVAMWPELAGGTHADNPASINAIPFPKGTSGFFLGYYISAQTRHSQAAWQWLCYLSLNATAQELQRLPVRQSLAESMGYWDKVGSEAAAIQTALTELYAPIPLETRQMLVQATQAACGDKTLAQPQATAQPRAAQGPAQARSWPTPVPMPSFPLRSQDVIEINYCGKKRDDGQVAELFNAAQDQIRVNLATPQVSLRLSLRDFAEQCDCFSWYEATAYGIEQGLVLDLQPLIDADPDFSLDDFAPPAIKAFRWQGDLWGLPLALNPTVIYYNKTLFDQAGVPYPQLEWTWNDFLDTAKQLTLEKDGKRQYGFVDLVGLERIILPFIIQHGGQIVDNPLAPNHPTLDAPAVIEAVQWYFSLANEYQVMPMPLSAEARSARGGDQAIDLVAAGKAAMWAFPAWWPGQVTGLQRVGPLVGVLPMPRDVQSSTTFDFIGFYVSAFTAQPEACWVWLYYLSQHLPPEKAIPARISLLESQEFRQQIGQQTADAILTSVEFTPSPSHHWAASSLLQERVLARFEEALGRIAHGADVEAALQDAQKAVEQDLTENIPGSDQ